MLVILPFETNVDLKRTWCTESILIENGKYVAQKQTETATWRLTVSQYQAGRYSDKLNELFAKIISNTYALGATAKKY